MTSHDLFCSFVYNSEDMKAVVIEVKTDSDVKFWLKLAKKTGAKAKLINMEDVSDFRIADLIERGMKTKSVSRESVMEVLENKTGI